MSTDPKIAAGEDIIDSCPFCHAKFNAPIATNIKQTCPDEAEGGCGKSFLLKVFE